MPELALPEGNRKEECCNRCNGRYDSRDERGGIEWNEGGGIEWNGWIRDVCIVESNHLNDIITWTAALVGFLYPIHTLLPCYRV